MPPSKSSEPLDLKSFGSGLNVAVVGATGGIGSALADILEGCRVVSKVWRLARSQPGTLAGKGDWHHIDVEDEKSIAEAAAAVERSVEELHLVIVASGVLHEGERLQPEKAWRAITGPALEIAFRRNAIGPALVAKHFLPLLAKDRKAVFAALSARVGSIEDNQAGGWYAYRASKAALNMLIKTLAIELARRHKKALCVGLHPGTVDTAISKPFQSGVPKGQLLAPAQSARYLLTVLDRLTPNDSGHLYAWDGGRIPF